MSPYSQVLTLTDTPTICNPDKEVEARPQPRLQAQQMWIPIPGRYLGGYFSKHQICKAQPQMPRKYSTPSFVQYPRKVFRRTHCP